MGSRCQRGIEIDEHPFQAVVGPETGGRELGRDLFARRREHAQILQIEHRALRQREAEGDGGRVPRGWASSRNSTGTRSSLTEPGRPGLRDAAAKGGGGQGRPILMGWAGFTFSNVNPLSESFSYLARLSW